MRETDDIKMFTQEVLATIPNPWPIYLTLLVFLAIEHTAPWHRTYKALVAKYSRNGKDGRNVVNTSIGQFVKQLSGLETLHEGAPAHSRLIKTYTQLKLRG